MIIKNSSMLIILSLLCFSCEDKGGNQNSSNFIEIITTNVNQGDFLFNFETGQQVQEVNSNSWHLKYHNLDTGTGYKMPNIVLNNTLLLSINSTSDFESIDSAPDRSSFSPEGGRMQYGGPNAALNYDMTIHKVGVSKDTYLIYDTVTNRIYKITFDDYDGGVVVFRYSELSN